MSSHHSGLFRRYTGAKLTPDITGPPAVEGEAQGVADRIERDTDVVPGSVGDGEGGSNNGGAEEQGEPVDP